MKPNINLLVLCSLFLVACQSVTPTLVPTATRELLPNPTRTPPPADTPTSPPQTPTSTRVMPSPAPTLSPLDSASRVLTEFSIQVTHLNSPNGLCSWRSLLAFPINDDALLKYEYQFFTHVVITCYEIDVGEVEWVLVDEWSKQALGYSIPALLGWSTDEKYAYLYDSIIPDGCPGIGGYQRNFMQVDLVSGETLSIPIDGTGGIAISPDSTSLVYYYWQKAEVGVYDLVGAQEQRIPFELPEGIEYWDAGYFTWSPDGQSALFVIRYGDPCMPTGSSIRRVDIHRGNVRELVEHDDPVLSILEWSEADRVLISAGGENWWLDPLSGSLVAP